MAWLIEGAVSTCATARIAWCTYCVLHTYCIACLIGLRLFLGAVLMGRVFVLPPSPLDPLCILSILTYALHTHACLPHTYTHTHTQVLQGMSSGVSPAEAQQVSAAAVKAAALSE